jgi:hypothetical protein
LHGKEGLCFLPKRPELKTDYAIFSKTSPPAGIVVSEPEIIGVEESA